MTKIMIIVICGYTLLALSMITVGYTAKNWHNVSSFTRTILLVLVITPFVGAMIALRAGAVIGADYSRDLEYKRGVCSILTVDEQKTDGYCKTLYN